MDGNIDQLNFKLLIDEKDFSKQIDRIKKDAKQFNADLSAILDLRKRLSTAEATNVVNQERINQAVNRTRKALLDVEKAKEQANKERLRAQKLEQQLADDVDKQGKKQKEVTDQVKNTRNALQGTKGLLSEIATLTGVTFGAVGIRQFLSQLIRVTGEFEVQKMALGAMLQDSAKAASIFNEFRQLALESPYTFQDFTKFGKQLTAFNIPAEKLVDTTKMLADVAAGLGVDMGRIILAYGQIKSAGVLKGTELRQLTEAGVPILEELRRQIVETTGRTVELSEVFSMISKKQIPFEMVEKAFRDMTSEGGKFYNMQEVLVETLQGKIGKLRDVWQQALYDMGTANDGMLKGAVDALINLIQNFDRLLSVLGSAAKGWLIYKGAVSVARISQTAAEMGSLTMAIGTMGKGVSGLTSKIAISATKLSGWLGIGVTVGSLILRLIKDSMALNNELDKTLRDRSGEAEKMVREMDSLAAKLKDAAKGSKEYREAIHDLNTKYGDYLPNLLNENNALIEITKNANLAAEAIRNKARADAEEAGLKAINEKYDNRRERDARALEKQVRALFSKNISDDQVRDYTKYVLGLLEKQVDEGTRDVTYGFLKKTGEAYFEDLGLKTSQLINRGFRSAEIDFTPVNALQNTYATIEKVKKVTDDFRDGLDLIGGNYDSNLHAQLSREISAWYNEQLELATDINNEEERKNKILEIEKEHVRKLADMYDQIGRPDEAKRLRQSLVENNEILIKTSDIVNSIKQTEEKIKSLRSKDALSASEEKELSTLEQELTSLQAQYKLRKGIEYGKAEKEDRSAENAIRHRIDLLRGYKEALEEITKIVGPDLARTLMGQYFKDIDFGDFDFERMINEEIGKLEALGTASARQAAETLRATLSKESWQEGLKPIKAAADAVERFRDAIESLSKESTDIEGSGFWYKISKVTSDLQTKLNDLQLKGKKAKEILARVNPRDETQKAAAINALVNNGVEKEEAEKFWKTWVVEGNKAVDDLIAKLAGNARAKAAESARNLAKEYFDEFNKTNNIDLTNLTGKSLQELRRYKQELSKLLEMVNGKNLFGSQDKGLFAEYGLDLDNISTSLNLDDLFETMADDGFIIEDNVKSFLKLSQAIAAAGGSIDKFIESLQQQGKAAQESTKNAELQKLYASFSKVTSAITPFSEALIQLGEASNSAYLANLGKSINSMLEGIQGVLAAGAKEGATGMIVAAIAAISKSVVEAATAAMKFNEALAAARLEASNIKFETSLSKDVDSIFGKDSVTAIQNASQALAELKREMNKPLPEIKLRRAGDYTMFYKGFNDMLQARANELNMSLYDKYNNLNAETLRAILDTYSDLHRKEVQWMNQAIADSENYAKAMEQMEDVMDSVFGGIVSDAADAIVDKWKKAGDAALDYADILDDVATRYAKMLVESMLLDQVFNKGFKDNLWEAFSGGDVETAMAMVAEKMEEVTQLAPNIAAILAPLQQYIKDTGENTDSLREGISKELIERNSTLLTSYINGIRADVAVTRQDVHTYLPAIAERIGTLGQNSPSLALYQQEVAAHLANIEESNAAVARDMSDFLFRFKGLIGAASTGGSALRVMK